MRFAWRGDPLRRLKGWLSRIAKKDRVEGRSAVALARAWDGPLAVSGALAGVEGLEEFVFDSAVVEAQTRFDRFGGPRNHDLLLLGSAGGNRAIVSVESKNDERFSETVKDYTDKARKKRDGGKRTGALDRIVGLLKAFGVSKKSAAPLRYQLFTGVAGAIAAAVDAGAPQAVFLIHEFLDHSTDEENLARNHADLASFVEVVFGLTIPDADSHPWCIGPLRVFPGSERIDPCVRLYIAKARTCTHRLPAGGAVPL